MLQISLALVLLVLIVVFYSFPRFTEKINQQIIYRQAIEIITVPPTRQLNMRQPPPPRPEIPVAVEEPEILMPVVIESPSTLLTNNTEAEVKFVSGLPEGFRPKQILEVIPEKVSDLYNGLVILALKIGKKGMVIEHRVIKNTTGSGECVQQAIKAASSSIWEPAIIDGRPVIYWIEKTYQFNIEE